MSCPTCHSPEAYLHPVKKDGKPLKDVFVSMDHGHSHDGAPLTITVCNDEFHRYEGVWQVCETPQVVISAKVEAPKVGEALLLDYLRKMHETLSKMNVSHADRLAVWANCAGVIDQYSKDCWGG